MVITLGEKGCFYLDASKKDNIETGIVPVNQDKKTVVVDTIGAGDSHIGALICAIKRENSLKDACKLANSVSEAVVSVAGANLSDSDFANLKLF